MIEEKYLVYVVLAGGGLVLLAYLWCLARAFGKGFFWGLLSLIPPFFLLWAFSASARADGKRRGGKGPVVLAILGVVLIVGTITVNKYHAAFPNRTPFETFEDGKLHVTLTNWGKTDYSFLSKKKDVVVLQMGNEDVTNETLKYLVGMDQLEELNLNDSQIDDDGLALIATLPKLRVLKVSRTKVTDEGFDKHLATMPTLKEVTVKETAIKGKSLRDWKNADKDNRLYVGP